MESMEEFLKNNKKTLLVGGKDSGIDKLFTEMKR